MKPNRRHLASRQFADVYPFVILTDQDARRLAAIEVEPSDIEAARSFRGAAPAPEPMSSDQIIRTVAAGTRERDLGRLEQGLAAHGVLVSQAELDAIGCRLPLQPDPNGGRLARFDLDVVPTLIRDGRLLPEPDDGCASAGHR